MTRTLTHRLRSSREPARQQAAPAGSDSAQDAERPPHTERTFLAATEQEKEQARKSGRPMPSGKPEGDTRANPASLPGPYPLRITGISGPATTRDRTLWGVLLHAVWPELGQMPSHELPLSRINGMFRERGGGQRTDWIWPAAQRLARTQVHWVGAEDEYRSEGVEAVFGAVVREAPQHEATLRFHFPSLLVPILQDPQRFARLRTHVLLGLSGKYAATLYERLESVANLPQPDLTVPLSDLRRWLHVPEEKYPVWYELKRWVLDPVLKRLNHQPDEGTGFTVVLTPLRHKRAIHAVHFHVQKTEARHALERRLQQHQALLLLPAAAYKRAKAVVPGEDVYALQGEWEDWGRRKKTWPPKKSRGRLCEFL